MMNWQDFFVLGQLGDFYTRTRMVAGDFMTDRDHGMLHLNLGKDFVRR